MFCIAQRGTLYHQFGVGQPDTRAEPSGFRTPAEKRPAKERELLKLVESKPVKRTKAALLEAFVELVLTRRYDEFRVADIIARAGVGRSTFYEHYDGKDDLLREGLAGPFGVLADIVIVPPNDMKLLRTVEHFWENRRLGNVLLAGPMRPLVVMTLAALIEHRLVEGARGRALSLPASLLAAQVAGGQLGLISAWLAGQGAATSEAIAGRLIASAASVLSVSR